MDHDKNRKLMREVLRVTGCQTMEAKTAEEGVRLASDARPSLILMDLQPPGMDGFAALAALRPDARTNQTPAIAVTASAMRHHRPRISAAGFDGCQTKPINVKEFLQAVREVVDRRGTTVG